MPPWHNNFSPIVKNMSPVESLHYAIGELAYIMARVDGKVQKEEREKFQNMVAAELRCKDYGFDVTDIIFQLLDKQRKDLDVGTTYGWAMHEIRLNGHYLSPKLKKNFTRFLEKIAKAYPPVTVEEKNIIDRFKEDIALIKGDPVFYGIHK